MSTQTAPITNQNEQPVALTFFLTPIQRRAVLRTLKPLSDRRAEALLAALKLSKLSAEAAT